MLIWARDSEERPPIIELNDMRPNMLDARCWLGSGLGLLALNVVRLRPLESACCFVSAEEEDHLEKSGPGRVKKRKGISNRERCRKERV